MPERVLIERLGARADGIAHVDGRTVYVPYVLPGETVLVEGEGSRASLVAVETPSPDRIESFCPYFGRCGGCLTQHVAEPTYAAWKRGLVVQALAQASLDAPVDPLVDAHGAGRRRITLHARFADGQAHVGYMAVRSHDLVKIAFCPIAEPGLKEAPKAALALAERLRGTPKPLDIQVTATDTGLDVDLRGHGPMKDRERQALVEAAGAHDLARLSLHGEVVVERRAPIVRMGAAQVLAPPGGFLQATRAGEETLAALVTEACAGAKRVADLFSGCGPFALRLAERAEVLAADGDARSLAALDRAARGTPPSLRPVTTETRDLFRRPLLVPELDRFDAVVIDPPRAGAEAQARQLALSKVPAVASVSCDPGTFVRDAAILAAGGYRLKRVVPVDQFKYSPHLEIVGVFVKPPARPARRPARPRP
ncbi:MAG TPA: TRAM domain-containing protein [Beijerinckiaceae bacterium]